MTTSSLSATLPGAIAGHFMRITTPQTIHTITPHHPAYPPHLKTIPKPPNPLYVRGNLETLTNLNTIAIVGTRKATRYGLESTREITTALTSANFTIISGLALGIDGTAHQTTLDTNSITIAVLGTGLTDNEISPREHYTLAQHILVHNGALVSEYPPNTSYGRWTFAARNRIIAGMSQASVIIEAAEKSGALITAHHALDFNRDVFALPGPITSPTSQGTNTLIAKGAIPILGPQTILEYFGHTIKIPFQQNQKSPAFSDPLTTQIFHLSRTEKLSPELIAQQLNTPIQTILTHLTMIELQTTK